MDKTGQIVTPRPLIADVRAVLSTLRPAERRVAESLLANPAAFASNTVRIIAVEAQTSTATVMRFTRAIGYERIRDLQLDLTREAMRARMSLGDTEAQSPDIMLEDDLPAVVAKVAASETLSISDTAAALDVNELRGAASGVAASRRIDIYGVGASGVAAMDLQMKLSRIGLTALHWHEPHAAWTAAAVLDDTTVAIAISHSGTTGDTVEFLKLAGISGATTVAITNWAASPLARNADFTLRTAARETSYRSAALGSRIAQLMTVDCLFLAVAKERAEVSATALRRTREAIDARAPVTPVWPTG